MFRKKEEKYESKTMQYIEKYKDRYTFEWFTRAENDRYWKMTKRLVYEETRKTAILAAISTAISVAALLISIFC